ncbi:MAG: murein transglycosylase A [Prochlorothrix sp.]
MTRLTPAVIRRIGLGCAGGIALGLGVALVGEASIGPKATPSPGAIAVDIGPGFVPASSGVLGDRSPVQQSQSMQLQSTQLQANQSQDSQSQYSQSQYSQSQYSQSHALPALCPVTDPRQQLAPRIGLDTQLWGDGDIGKADRSALLQAIDHSLRYLNTAEAEQAYAAYPIAGVSRDRVYRSLRRFRVLLQWATSPQQLQRWVRQEFDFYQATGHDGQGSVDFTGYFEPQYQASLTPSATYRYPLYRRPPDLDRWPQPHPTRLALEGADGLQGAEGPLAGLELVWLADRLEAYLVQVQGSARLELVQGGSLSVGYDGRTEYSYTSLGKALVEAGRFSLEELTLPKVLGYFEEFPAELDLYIPRNDRFIFFRETQGAPPTGSLGVPVTADRSIAADKSLMPPGALALLVTDLPYGPTPDQLEPYAVSRYVLDQDTGGAIKGAGRVDIFLGSGALAGARAGLVNTPGQLYYLLLKN